MSDIEPPANIDYGTVTGRFIYDVNDSPDPDVEPDYKAMTGTVTFVASVFKVIDPGALPVPVIIGRVPIVCVLDEEGYLCTSYDGAAPAYHNVQLIATDDADLNPVGWTWDVNYDLKDQKGKTLRGFDPHPIAVLAGTTRDLSTAIPADGAQTVSVAQAEALAAQAAADALEARAAAEAAEAAMGTRVQTNTPTVMTATTTLSTLLTAPVGANQEWLVEGHLIVDGAQAADFKMQLQATGATGATGYFGVVPALKGSASSTTTETLSPINAVAVAASGGASLVFGTIGVGSLQMITFKGYVKTSATAGSLAIRVAPGSSDATNTTVSYAQMNCTRLS